MNIRHTPWGYADNVEPRGKQGIAFVSTPSHGGFYVPPELLGLIPTAWLHASFNRQGMLGWFEEDCDWCMVALTFQAEFSVEELQAASSTFAHWINPKLEQVRP